MSRIIPLEHYRNIGILGTPDAGRTTTTERLLSLASARPNDGMDARDITLTSAATSFEWNDCRFNLIALPAIGQPADAASLSALDAIVFVVDAEAGVTSSVEAAIRRAGNLGLAALVFVNKIERTPEHAEEIVADIPNGVALQIPAVADGRLNGLVELISMLQTSWPIARFDAAAETGSVPAELKVRAEAGRATLLAVLPPGPGALSDRLRGGVQAGTLVPVLFGSAFLNRGVAALLDAMVRYLPAPSEVPLHAESAEGARLERRAADDEPFAGLAFQVLDDPIEGRLTFVRVCSGIIAAGSETLNTMTMSSERVGAMVRIHANHAERVDEARTGDVVALAGLQHTHKGDTLCDPNAPVILGGFRPRSAA
jgi:elongation factor G